MAKKMATMPKMPMPEAEMRKMMSGMMPGKGKMTMPASSTFKASGSKGRMRKKK